MEEKDEHLQREKETADLSPMVESVFGQVRVRGCSRTGVCVCVPV